jgi:hypothetical protein
MQHGLSRTGTQTQSVNPTGPMLLSNLQATSEHRTCAPEAMHIYLLQQVHEAGVDLGQEAQEEDEREAQGEHWPRQGMKAQSTYQPLLHPPSGAHSPGLPLPCPDSPVATSRAQKKKEAEKSVRP